MRFLIDASMPRSASNVLTEFGHEAIDVRDIGMRSALDERIAARALENGEVLVSRDFDFADIRNYPPDEFCGIVVLKLPEHATATEVCNVLRTFVQKKEWIEQLNGRLAIVEPWRVRFRASG